MHAFAHVTGGGLAANLARVLPAGTGATVDRGTWRPPAIFGLLAGHGGIGQDEMERVFNMGVGMAAVVARGRRRPRRAPADCARYIYLACR